MCTLLTIKETAQKYKIGEKKLRSMIREPKCPFVLFVGTKALIKAELFEKYLEHAYSI